MQMEVALTLGIGVCTLLMIVLIIVLFCVVQSQTHNLLAANREREQALKALLTSRRQTKTVPDGVKIVLLPGRELVYAHRNNSPNSDGSFMTEERRQMMVTPATDFPPVLYRTDLIDIESMENYSQMDRYSAQSYSQPRSNTPAASDTSIHTPNSEPNVNNANNAQQSGVNLQAQSQHYVGSPPGRNQWQFYQLQQSGQMQYHKAKSDKM